MRSGRPMRVTGGLAAGLGLGLALAWPSPAMAVQFRYKFKPGSKATYRVMIAAGALAQTPLAPETMKMQFSMDMRTIQKVVGISRSGVADLEWTNTTGTMKMTAMGRTTANKTPREVSRLKLTDRGKLLSYKTKTDGEPAAEAPAGFDQADPMRALAGLNFPDRDLRPGDTWATESKVDLGNGQSMVMKIASRFVALVDYKGRKCAKITTAFEMPMDPTEMNGRAEDLSVKGEGKVAGQMMTLFDNAAGREVYADGSVIMLMRVHMSGGPDPSEAGQSIEMKQAMKLNVRQVLID
jgi:hypothetical protein